MGQRLTRLKTAKRLAASILLAGALLGLGGCGSQAPGGLGASQSSSGGAVGVSCAAAPQSGCPCSTAGATADCGEVTQVSGNYVTCSLGELTCSGGVWGSCVGDRITTKSIGGSGLSLQGLGATQPCMNDPCDPLCNEFVDTPTGLNLPPDSGLEVTDAGLTAVPVLVSDSGVECTGLTVNPPTSNVVVTSLSPITTSPATVALTASYTPAGCYAGFANAAWSIDKTDLATISSGVITLVSAVAGPITATAYSGGFQASGVVNVTANVVDTTQAPAGTASQFVGAGTAPDNIQILYPYPATVFPRSIAAPVVQWNNNGVAAAAVKVTIQYPATGTPTYSVALVLPESSPPQAALGQTAWGFLDQTAAGQNALISIQRLVNGTLLEPTTETVHFATTALRGNIYYTEYDNTAWTGNIKNLVPFGTTPATIAVNGEGFCPVCHTVSSQGNMLVTSNWGYADETVDRVNSDGTLTPIADVANVPASMGAVDSRGLAYSPITPDGLYALQGTNWWGNTLANASESPSYRPHNNGWGLLGSYYANATFSGSPAFSETDETVDFTWGAGSPGAGIGAGSSYSVMWTGYIQPTFSQTYTFEVESSDGVELTVNGQTLINSLAPQADKVLTGTLAVTAGVKLPIVLKYENVSNTAQVHLRWSSTSQALGVVPESQLYPALLPVVQPGQYLGCYGDAASRDLPTLLSLNPVDPATCELACAEAGFLYAGLQYASQCFCGNGYGKYGTSTNCNMACTGNSAQICGGGYANSVYAATVPPPCTAGQYLGCFGDAANRDLPTQVSVNPVTTTTCETACAQAGLLFAGLQYADECWCGDSYGSYGTSTNCTMACSGNSAEICGGGWTNSVYTAYCPNPVNAQLGLLGTYYANENFTGTSYTRIDPDVDFDWNGNPPAPGIGAANWSAEWTGQVTVPCADNYFWCVQADDGVRLWIDGVLVDNGWVPESATWYCNSVTGSAIHEAVGKHDIKMDYFQASGGSSAQLFWNAGCVGDGLIPSVYLSPTGDQGTGGYNLPVTNMGDVGSGYPYNVFQVSAVAGIVPSNVSAASPNDWGLGSTAMMVPTFSPDGTKLVFVDGDTSGGASWRQGLSFFNFNEGGKLFTGRTNFVNSVAAQNIIRWPAIEPDSRSVIYQTNPTTQDDLGYGGMGPSGYSTIPGELWSVDMESPVTDPPVPLKVLNAGLAAYDSNLSYQPSVLPTSAGGYRWTVFTSDRQYGNTQNTVPGGDNTDQLWVAALDDTLSAGADRSHPPFWLPNQVLGANGGRIRNERGYWVLPACKPSLANLNPPVGGAVPTFSGTDMDIGSVGFPGSASSNAGVYTIVASGDDIWNQADAFNYLYMPISGDFILQARVTSLANDNQWAKAGIMLRNDLSAAAANEMVLMNAVWLTDVQWRAAATQSATSVSGISNSFPFWLQLARSGTVITGSVSLNGVSWTPVATEGPSIGSSAYLGLAVTSHDDTTTTTATFDNVRFQAVPPVDPRPASLCQDDQDCCGAATSPPTAACTVDIPLANPVTRHCLLLNANSCVATGGACNSDADCCGFPNDHCVAGVCAAPPPVSQYPQVVYTEDYTATCPVGTQVVWRDFLWETITPGNSDIRFLAATAPTEAALPTADTAMSVVYLTEASGPTITALGIPNDVDVQAALKAAGQTSQSYLRIFVDFQPTSDHTQGPTLTNWEQQYDCAASE